MTEKKTDKKVEETAAADTLATHSLNRSHLMAMIVNHLTSHPYDELQDLAKALSASHTNNTAGGVPDGAAAHNADSIKAKADPMSGMNAAVREDLNKAFEGTDLSEEFKEKATTLFEAAVSARVAMEKVSLEEQFAENMEQVSTALKTEMVENIDSYLDYIAKEWLEENRVAITNELKIDLFSNFLEAQRKLFQEHYIEIPDDRLDVLADTIKKAETLEEKLNEQITANIELTKKVNRFEADKVFVEVSEGMALTDVEKFKTLAGDLMEGTSDVQDLKKKLLVIKESHFTDGSAKKPAAKPAAAPLSEEVITIDKVTDAKPEPKKNPDMASYVAAVSRSLGKR